MNKLNREIDMNKVNHSKERTMNFVMDEITPYKKPWYHVFKVNSYKLALPVAFAVFVLALIFINNPANPTSSTNPVISLSSDEQSTLAEMSYLSGTIVAYAFDTTASNLTFLNTETTTVFEDDIDEFNQYFDLLRLYLDDTSFDDNITVTLLEDDNFDILISFTSNDQTYEMYLTSTDEDTFEGDLIIDGLTFNVSGTITEEDDEISMNMEAVNGNNSVSIEYESELSDEIETNYEITTNINGVTKRKEIKVEMDGEEAKVEIKENEDSYELTREIIDGMVTYKLEYKLGETEGEAFITEVINTTGETSYRYHIEENDIERDIETNKPDIPRGRNNDDETDDDDDKGNGNPFDEEDEVDDQSHFNDEKHSHLKTI